MIELCASFFLFVCLSCSAFLFLDLNHLLFHFSNEAYLAWHNLFVGLLAAEDESMLDGELGLELELSVGGLAEDAELGGIYSTPTSQQALQENKQRKLRAIEAMRKSVLATSEQQPEQPAGQHKQKQKQPGKSVQTAWEATHKQSLWNFLRGRPALERNFAAAMGQIDASVNRALVADYAWDTLEVLSSSSAVAANASDPSPSSAGSAAAVVRSSVVAVESVVDLGGSVGSFLGSVLAAHPAIPRGVLFDLEGNIAEARKELGQPSRSASATSPFAALAATQSVELVAGDFFRGSTLPLPLSATSGTKYVLRQILHDWSDWDVVRILHGLRSRLRGFANVAVAIVEVNKQSPESSPTRSWVDFQMLVCCNAKERTLQQWQRLFAVTGWKITQHTLTRSHFAVIEIQPDDEDTAAATTVATAASSGQDANVPQENTAASRAPLAAQSTATAAAQPKQEL